MEGGLKVLWSHLLGTLGKRVTGRFKGALKLNVAYVQRSSIVTFLLQRMDYFSKLQYRVEK